MADKLTDEQRVAVENRGGKLLVSAAAGSGKTKVLVDRLMSYILDPVNPANIDDFLIITYTKAAASELRGKIASKLSELISESPNNKHLLNQMQRLYLANISTVHGFCGDLLRQYAYRLDIPSDFRVADENECLQLQLKALDQVLNDAYLSSEQNPYFYAFIDSQGLGRDDRQIPEIILKVYNSARCHSDPAEWLNSCIYNTDDIQDAADTPWGEFLIADFKQFISYQIEAFNRCIIACAPVPGMEKPSALFASVVAQFESLRNCTTWDAVVDCKNIDFGRLTFPTKCRETQLALQMKAVFGACKEGLKKYVNSFSDKSEQVLFDLQQSLDAARGLIALVKSFADAYSCIKKNRSILDFSDLEHITLDLLKGKNRATITAVAREVGESFREVMVDEYQDSNEIQDAIFSALTERRQNCFMVGDVKQSIYQFRLADPEIFIDKYNTYTDATVAQPNEGRKAMLTYNFRSSGGVISAVNDIFMQSMSSDVGGIDYGEQEMLREFKTRVSINEPEVTLYGIDVESDTYAEEADFTAKEICSLLDGTHYVRNGDELRPIQPEDIVILLRSPGSVGAEFQYALQKRGVRCVTGDSTDLLHTEEIATIRSLLQIINNPLQDIPLVSVLASPLFGFTADDLATLRSVDRYQDMYHLLSVSDNKKCKHFMQVLNEIRAASRLMSVTELISEIFKKSNILSIFGAMPDGDLKCNNLQMFYQVASNFESTGPKDLLRFLDYIDSMEDKGLFGTAGQQEKGAVTIMSIHKSKGLEFPVVFLCSLSRNFNQESTRAQVLCHKKLGLGLNCADPKLRVRYPTIAKRAISAKILRESISEEMRVLYVALTRARDRLYMTYATKKLGDTLLDIAMRLDMCSGKHLASEAKCPGWWVLQSAMTRTEAGEFFAASGHPDCAQVRPIPWNIKFVESNTQAVASVSDCADARAVSNELLQRFSSALNFRYSHENATRIPSKLTATQLKGRLLDREISEGTSASKEIHFRAAGAHTEISGTSFGSAVHAVLQHIQYSACVSEASIADVISRLVKEKLVTEEQAKMVDCSKLFAFFASDIGKKVCCAENVLREFKFSVLCDAGEYYENAAGEKVLLQGVVDLAIIDDDGIVVLDFKTDRITENNIDSVIQNYKSQVTAYANALTRIYQKPIKAAMLYFFALNRFVDVL